jgi:cobalt-precorrin 5A hydrolase
MSLSAKHQRYFAGIGCRRGCSEASLRELLESALQAHSIPLETIGGIASIDSKRDEVGLNALAATLNIPLHFFPAAELNRFSDRVDAAALVVLLETGAANIAEASALALTEMQTEQIGELIIRKCKNADATFALASPMYSNNLPNQSPLPPGEG